MSSCPPHLINGPCKVKRSLVYIQARNQLFIGVVPTLLLPFPFPPFLSSLFPFPSLPLLPSFPSRPFHAPTPKIQLGVLGERCMLPSESVQRPAAKRILDFWCN